MRRLAALVLAALCSTGCQGGAPDVGRYAALGDSYTAGTGSGPQVSGQRVACGQVTTNYPRLVAKTLSARLVDASCAGARTSNATTPQPIGTSDAWPAQLDAVAADTEVVTVGLGYNDGGFFSDALFGCTSIAPSDPTGAPCQESNRAAGVDLAAVADRAGGDLRVLLRTVQQRAPHATVLLVGYPQLVPATGTCPALPLASGDYAYVRGLLGHLDDVMRDAAHDAGATFVDVHGASEGHDICAGTDAWVNGATARAQAAAYHPFAAEQRAVADLVVKALDS